MLQRHCVSGDRPAKREAFVKVTAIPFDYYEARVFDVNYFCRLCRLFLPVLFLLSTPLLGHAGPVAGHVEF